MPNPLGLGGKKEVCLCLSFRLTWPSLWGWLLFLLGQGPSLSVAFRLSHCPTSAGVVATDTVVSPLPLTLDTFLKPNSERAAAPVSCVLLRSTVAGCLRG